MLDTSQDTALIKSVINGDQRGFDRLFDLYFPRLYRFALSRLSNEDWAEEAVQAGLGKALLKLKTFRGEASLYTWLCTFCRHEVGYILKREKPRGNILHLSQDDPDTLAALESLALILRDKEPDSELERSQIIGQVQSVLDHLPSLYGDILEWRYIKGFSVNEIALRIDRSYKATESALSRARLAFKEAFVSLNATTGINDLP